MPSATAFILCICISTAYAEEEAATKAKCSNPTGNIDGYNLLAPNSTFRLKKITFPIQAENVYRCITATTVDRNDEEHEVLETVEYDVNNSEKRDGYSQRFQFRREEGSDQYNIMQSSGTAGAPDGIYKFWNTDPACIVLEALKYALPSEEAVVAEARSADNTGKPKTTGQCMLWVRDDEENAPDSCCLHMFKELCPDKDVRHSFSDAGCQKQAAEDSAKEQSEPGPK
uniref:Putative lipocalin-6 1 n=1 Tax=Amblyomma triste TaxID=251400 RepID=A0A023GB53_AMBTT